LVLAREMHPGQRNNLDALAKRYNVDNSRRELHGALLDARILADVYLAMTGGQGALALSESVAGTAALGGRSGRWCGRPRRCASSPPRTRSCALIAICWHSSSSQVAGAVSGPPPGMTR